MKKKALIGIFIVLALTVTLFTAAFSAMAEETDAPKGSVYTIGDDGDFTVTEITANRTDGYYYTNEKFGFKLTDEDAASRTVYYLEVADKDDLPADTAAFQGASIAEYDKSALVLKENYWYVFAEKYTEEDEEKYSDLAVVYYDTTAPEVDGAKLTEYLLDSEQGHKFYNANISASSELKLPTDWAKNVEILKEITAQKTETDGETGNSVTSNSDSYYTITFEYCTPSDYYDSKEWSSSDDDISVKTTGYWYFRYVITDLAGNSVTTEPFVRYVIDTDAPTIEFTSSQEKVSTSGTVAGSPYTVPTPTITDDAASTSYTYQVMKKINGEWVVIYDSADGEVPEEYKDFVTTSTITPAAGEISQNETDFIYKVVYTAKDSNGHSAVKELNILTTAPDRETDPYEVWKIVLIVIACLAAAGIIALIFVKPKEKTSAKDGRVHYGKDDDRSEDETDDKD